MRGSGGEGAIGGGREEWGGGDKQQPLIAARALAGAQPGAERSDGFPPSSRPHLRSVALRAPGIGSRVVSH